MNINTLKQQYSNLYADLYIKFETYHSYKHTGGIDTDASKSLIINLINTFLTMSKKDIDSVFDTSDNFKIFNHIHDTSIEFIITNFTPKLLAKFLKKNPKLYEVFIT